MWRDQWRAVPEVDNPITHITNGVHVQTWTALEMKNMFAEMMGGELGRPACKSSVLGKSI